MSRYARTLVPILVALFLLYALPPTSIGSAPPVSYNPAPAESYHAPLSGVGLIAATHAYDGLRTSGALQGTSLSQGGGGTIPTGLVRFINDSSYMPQSETSVAVSPTDASVVVGGYNDGRYFFCPLLRSQDCPGGYTKSISGFTVSTDGGATVAKSNDLPGISVTERNLTSGLDVPGFLVSWGDPSVVAAPDGTFYYSALAIDPVSGANGVMLAKSDSQLSDPATSCATPLSSPSTNQCWTAVLLYGNLSFQCKGPGLCSPTTFEDKDLSAVDTSPGSPYYGYVYTAWTHFNSDGTSAIYAYRCSPSLTCVQLSGGTSPTVSGTDQFADFGTPAVGHGGSVYIAWCNFGTATSMGPVVCSSASSPPGGHAFGSPKAILSYMGVGTDLAGDSAILGFATEQFRASSVPTFVASPQSAGTLYFAVAVCTSGSYYVFQGAPSLATDNPGNCGESAVYFTRSLDGGSDWTTPTDVSAPGVVIQPSLTADPATGAVVLAYYSTLNDPFNHRVDVLAAVSTSGGSNFTTVRVTPVSNEPSADPSLFDYNSTSGGALVVPQYGDYMWVTAQGGKVWVLFTGNYASEGGTLQSDPFLATIGEAPATLTMTPTSGPVAPGDVVAYNATGFTPGTAFSVSADWSGTTVTLATGTVPPSGTISGNFTVPNIASDVYSVVARDGRGAAARSTLEVGQVSLTGVQAALDSIRSDVQLLSSSIGAMQSSILGRITSLGSSVNSTVTAAQSQISGSVSALGSRLELAALLSLVILLLAAMVFVFQFLTYRRRVKDEKGTSAPIGQPALSLKYLRGPGGRRT